MTYLAFELVAVGMPVNTYWKLRGAKVLERMPTNGADRYRTCCNCWHIRTGTLLLGVIELTAVSVLLSGIIRQIIWKNAEKSLCRERLVTNFWMMAYRLNKFEIRILEVQ